MMLKKYIHLVIIFLAFIILGIYQHHSNQKLEQKLAEQVAANRALEQRMSEQMSANQVLGQRFASQAFTNQNLEKKASSIEQKAVAMRMVYVYSLEETLEGINILEKKQKFEQDALALNDEVAKAEQKIKNLKKEKVKEDFSDVYLDSLRLKRDNLVEEYHKMLEDLTAKVNKGLEEIAKEKDASTIFTKNAVAVSTPYVIDVTPILVEKLKNQAQ